MSEIYFVSPQGSNRNSGSISSPFATIQKAHELVEAGDTIFLRGGRYDLPQDKATILSKSGTANNPIKLFAYQDEKPILDASQWTRAQEPYDPATKNIIIQDGNAWHVKGLELTGGPRSAYLARSVSDSRWEQLDIHHNDNTGLNLTGDNTNNNLILNSDFHHNFDPINNGQDADGVGIKFGSGSGNVIRNSRFYNNSDDGVDFWMYESPVTIENSWAFGNGFDRWDFGDSFEGNGNGYKFGGGRPTVPAVNHTISNSLAWNNASRGFDFNSNPGAMQVLNNTSFENGRIGFRFTEGIHRLKNNLSIGNEIIQVGGQTDDTDNSWTLGVEINSQDFLSTDAAIAEGERGANGQLPESDFLKLAPGSDLIDAGADIGNGFAGTAPDLGAFEATAVTDAKAPVAQLLFDEDNGIVARDTSPKGQDNRGRLLSGTTRVAGIDGGAVEFSQSGQGIAIANSPDINLSAQGQRTVSLWFNGQNVNQGSPQILYEEGGLGRGLNAYLEDGKLFVGGWNRAESRWRGTWLSTEAVQDNQWHNVTLVLDGTETVQADAFTGYLDGQKFGSGEGSQLWRHGDRTGVGKIQGRTRLRSGALQDPGAYFDGKIDTVQIFNDALTPEEVKDLAAIPEPPNNPAPLITPNQPQRAGLNFRGMPKSKSNRNNLKSNIDFADSPALSEEGNVSLKNVRYRLDTDIEANRFNLVLRDRDRLSKPELVVNSGFDDLEGWTTWDDTVSIELRNTIAGNDSWIQIETAGGGLGQSIGHAIEAGQDYVVSGLGQLTERGDKGLIGVLFKDEAGETFQTETISFRNSNPQRLRLGFTAPSAFSAAHVFAWKANSRSEFFVDEISVVQEIGGEVTVN